MADIIQTSALTADTGFVLTGAAAADLAGWSVASAGDVNGDGYGDFAIGAIGSDGGGASSGSVYVVFGTAAGYPQSISLSSLDGTNGFVL